jgi:muconolactone delta-isomerase
MKQHEREFFVYNIRSGTVYLDNDIEIRPATIRDKLLAAEHYADVYNEAIKDGMMTEDELTDWMISSELWTNEQEQSLKQATKDVEKLKKEIFKNYLNDEMVHKIRLYLRAAEAFRDKQLAYKSEYQQKTVEGVAATEELIFLLSRVTYRNGERYDFSDIDVTDVLYSYYQTIVSESIIRDLARNAPWKTLWSIKDNTNIRLFDNKDNEELTPNQQALIIWSQTYDNIQESMDCPTAEVINDDDMLDGWFILQAEKRDKQKSEKDFDDKVKSNKIKNSSEVFVMAKSKKEKDRVDNMNDAHGAAVKQQRYNLIKRKGTVGQSEFADEKLRLRAMATNQFKDSIRRR